MTGWRKSSHCVARECVEARDFRRSSHCAARECTEVGTSTHGVAVRDSSDRDGPVLEFDVTAWTRFTAGLKAA